PQKIRDTFENFDSNTDLNFFKSNFENFYKQLNEDQKFIFESVSEEKHKIFFIDGPGGSGKTFLYTTLIYYYLSKNKKILLMAWTGIASILLPQGITSNRSLRLP
ncbi:AAA family ATPase, partial [Salmonella enterica subsp. enterica serovar Typhimurium]|nr:AAA family ATPase [Salmonella enterica subsp. enterica serovar Typhimurium]